MIKKTFPLLILFLISFSLQFAQELYLCESYTENGTPVGPINRLEIKPYGTAIYVLLDNGNEFNDPLLYLFVDKFVDGKFTPFDSKSLEVKGNDTWAVTSYEFKEQGIYEVYFLNSSQSRLATNKIEVLFEGEYLGDNFASSSYSNIGSQFIFCEMVINGKPTNPFTSLSLSKSDGQTFIYLNNYVPFGHDTISVQYWKRSSTDSSYEELIDSKIYKILPEWSDTFFKYNFNSIGDYKIDIFDTKNNLIASNIIIISK